MTFAPSPLLLLLVLPPLLYMHFISARFFFGSLRPFGDGGKRNKYARIRRAVCVVRCFVLALSFLYLFFLPLLISSLLVLPPGPLFELRLFCVSLPPSIHFRRRRPLFL